MCRTRLLLFQPSFIGLDYSGIHTAIETAVSRVDIDLHHQLYNNVVLNGGSTSMPGFAQRLQKELQTIPTVVKNGYNVNINAPPTREHSVWIGGAILASLSTFQPMLVTKEEYDECGATIVHRR